MCWPPPSTGAGGTAHRYCPPAPVVVAATAASPSPLSEGRACCGAVRGWVGAGGSFVVDSARYTRRRRRLCLEGEPTLPFRGPRRPPCLACWARSPWPLAVWLPCAVCVGGEGRDQCTDCARMGARGRAWSDTKKHGINGPTNKGAVVGVRHHASAPSAGCVRGQQAADLMDRPGRSINQSIDLHLDSIRSGRGGLYRSAAYATDRRSAPVAGNSNKSFRATTLPHRTRKERGQ